MLLGAIEAGGTKFVCAVANEELTILDRISIKTENPTITMDKVVNFFKKYHNKLKGIGVGSFGPIDAKVGSSTYGYITSTPKLQWRNYNFVETLRENFDVPVTWTSDVNASAIGEYKARDNQEAKSLVYYTVGTGIGGGAVENGQLIGGKGFTEMGHQIIKRHPNDDYVGTCPYHGDCLEGLASGPAILERYNLRGEELEESHPYWDILAYYLAQCAINTTQFYTPDIIIFGGGVMKQTHLFNKIRQQFNLLNQSYMSVGNIGLYITAPVLGDNAAILGCLHMIKEEMSVR